MRRERPPCRFRPKRFNRIEKLEATGVPYKSRSGAMLEVISGRAPFMVVDLASSQPRLKAGKLRALALTRNDDDEHPV